MQYFPADGCIIDRNARKKPPWGMKGRFIHMKKLSSILSIAAATIVLFAGCGSKYADSAPTKGYDMNTSEAASMGWYDEEAADDIAWDEPAESAEMSWDVDVPMTEPEAPVENIDADTVKASERKIIKNRTISVETLEYDSFIKELEVKVSAYGGYIENSTQNGNSYYGKAMRSANYTIRIPAERFDEFTSLIGDMGTVTYSYEYIDDITAKYVDTEARIASLRAEQESFLKLMERAETVEDILKIQSYLTDVNYQIESYTTQLNSYKSLVSYSTLRLDITEVERLTPPAAKPGVFDRISQNISDNLYNIGEGFKDMFVGIVSSAPYLGIYAVVILVIVIIVRLIIRKVKKSSILASEPAKPNAENPENNESK